MAHIRPLYNDWLKSLDLEKGNLFELHRGYKKHLRYFITLRGN